MKSSQSGYISRGEGCKRFGVAPLTVGRWVKSGKLKPQAKQKLKSGQWGYVFDPNEFARLAMQGRKSDRKWELLYNNLLEAGCKPHDTLDHIAFSPQEMPNFTHVIDIDLAHAGIKLTLEHPRQFLKYLSQQKPLDGSFPSEVARLLGTRAILQLTGGQVAQTEKTRVRDLFKSTKSIYHFGEVKWSKSQSDRIMALRDLLNGTRPLYLDRIKCCPPAWAKTSVVPYRGSSRFPGIAAKIKELAASDPDIAAAKHLTEKSLIESRPVGNQKSLEKLTNPKGETKPALAPPEALNLIRFLGIDLELAEHIFHLMTQLRNSGVPWVLSKAYCLSFYRRVHHDALADLRQIEQPNWRGPAGAIPLPLAVVNRVFCTDARAGLNTDRYRYAAESED